MALMDIIKARHSIRKYTDEQIKREDLEKILEAGNYAPNAGGGQRSMMVAVHNKELTAHIGKMNMAHFELSFQDSRCVLYYGKYGATGDRAWNSIVYSIKRL